MSDDSEKTVSNGEFRQEVKEFEFDDEEKRLARKFVRFLDDESLRETHDLDDEEVQHAEILLANFYYD